MSSDRLPALSSFQITPGGKTNRSCSLESEGRRFSLEFAGSAPPARHPGPVELWRDEQAAEARTKRLRIIKHDSSPRVQGTLHCRPSGRIKAIDTGRHENFQRSAVSEFVKFERFRLRLTSWLVLGCSTGWLWEPFYSTAFPCLCIQYCM